MDQRHDFRRYVDGGMTQEEMQQEVMRAVASLLQMNAAPIPTIVPMLPSGIEQAAKTHNLPRHNVESVYFGRGNQIFWPVGRDLRGNIDLLAHEYSHAIQQHNNKPLNESQAEWAARKILAWPQGR